MKSSKWRFQVLKQKLPEHIADVIGCSHHYAVYEYYPDVEGSAAHTAEAVVIEGESVEDLKKLLLVMLNDIEEFGVLDYGVTEKK